MSYESLAVKPICSEDEISIQNSREMNALRKDQKLLRRAKFLKKQIRDLKEFTVEGMSSILETIDLIGQNSRMIFHKRFDG